MRAFFANKKLVFAGSFAAIILGVGVTAAYAQNTATSGETPTAATSVPAANVTDFSGLGITAGIPSDRLTTADPANTAQRAELVKQLDRAVAAGTMSQAGKERVLTAFDQGMLILGPTDPVAAGSGEPQIFGSQENLPVPNDFAAA